MLRFHFSSCPDDEVEPDPVESLICYAVKHHVQDLYICAIVKIQLGYLIVSVVVNH